MLKIVLLGPPGSGKGTQANLLCKKFLLKHISTGDLLRRAIIEGTELGIKASILINKGQLVSDQIIIDLVTESISTGIDLNSFQGLILDGFPRNVIQAQALENNLSIDWIIYLNVKDQIIIDRLAGRRYHPNSGRVYHLAYNPPKELGIDDLTGEPLIIRSDDQEEVIRERLSVYHKNTEQLIDWYKSKNLEHFIEVDAACNQNDIFKKILITMGCGSLI